jgi:chain length determinant protein EpsF
MNFTLLVSALRARFGVVALVLGVTVLAALAASLLIPKSYKAMASLLVDANKDPQQSLSPTDFYAQPRERINYMQTQVGIITSAKVAQAVARDLKLAEDPKTQEAFREARYPGTIDAWLGAMLLESLKVETSQSNIINISYTAADPQLASRVANAFAQTYIDTTLELRVVPSRQAAAWFDEQLKGLRANLEDAQAKLTAYQKQHGIVSTDERTDIEGMRLNDLAAQVMRAQEQARGRAGGGSSDQVPSVQSNPMVQRLTSDVAAGEAKLAEISANYGPNYPAYQRQVEENRALRQRLSAETTKAAAAVQGQRQQARNREAELRKELAEQHARVLELKQGRNEMGVLMRNVETAQKAYETASQRAVVSQVDSRASQTNIANLDAAAVPTRPARPRLMLNLALAAVVGMMLGLGIAIMLELLDRRVRSAADLANEWNVPLLGALNTQRSGTYALLGAARNAMPALPRPA